VRLQEDIASDIRTISTGADDRRGSVGVQFFFRGVCMTGNHFPTEKGIKLTNALTAVWAPPFKRPEVWRLGLFQSESSPCAASTG
jgi:hypothetical protein